MDELRECPSRRDVIERGMFCQHIRRGLEFWKHGAVTFDEAMRLLVMDFSRNHEDAMNAAIEASINAPPAPVQLTRPTEDRLRAALGEIDNVVEQVACHGEATVDSAWHRVRDIARRALGGEGVG